MKPSDLPWGLSDVNIEAPALWGARCILEQWRDSRGREKTNVDIVWDRQGALGEEPHLSELLRRLNERAAIQSFRQWAAHEYRFGGGETTYEVVFEGVRFHSNTCDSGGYLYVLAHLEPNVVPMPKFNDPDLKRAAEKLDRAFELARARGTL